MVQKQRREARKREREAREAAEEEEKQRLAEIETSEAAKRVEEAQKMSMKAVNAIKDEVIDEDMDVKVIRTVSKSSYNSIESTSSKSEISTDRSDQMRTRLKLADGNVDKASVITEGVYNQQYSSKTSGTNKISSLDSLVST